MKFKRIDDKLFYILFAVICFICSFLFLLFIQPIVGDEIWNYGFSYNISIGMIPYRDFNVMQTPLYFFLGSSFIKIFGNYLLSLYVLDSILITVMMILLFKLINWKVLIVYPFIVIFSFASYNLLCLFWIILIIYLINKKKDTDIIMGFIIGLVFLTKQNIGICLLVPALYYSKDKMKFLISFSIPILLMLLYLVVNNALYNFIDYCFLGLFEFNDKNKKLGPQVIFEILIVIFLCYKLIKGKFSDKEAFYILMFQIIAYPIFDAGHLCIAIAPVVYYFVRNLKSIYFAVIWFIIVWLLFILGMSYNVDIHKDKDFLYLTKNTGINLYKLESLIKKYGDKREKYYLMINIYQIKLYMGERINEFDLLNNGNMGYNGAKKRIKKIDDNCKEMKCIFFVERNMFDHSDTQFNREIFDYVVNSYEKIDEYEYIDVYIN